MQEIKAVKQNVMSKLEASIHHFLESHRFVSFITFLIILNGVILGLESYSETLKKYGRNLILADHIILAIFVIELILRFIAYKKAFFRNPWAVFDLVVVLLSFLPHNEVFSVLRTARVLRVLRIISVSPKLRRVIEGFISAIPGISSIAAILGIIIYVFAVMATKLFGYDYPEWFGTLHASIFTLFQIMTLEGWPDIVRTIMKTHPDAWIFFVIYILIATFSALNLFIAVIVDAMQKTNQDNVEKEEDQLLLIKQEIKTLRQKIEELK